MLAIFNLDHRDSHTISPHTTLWRYRLRLFSSVKNPSLPAINSRQSLANCCKILPASSTWAGLRPNIIHFPMRRFIIVSHRGSIVCGRFGGFSEVELRAFCGGTVVERARRAQREIIEPGSCLWIADRVIIVGVAVGGRGVNQIKIAESRLPKLGPMLGDPECSRMRCRG